MPIKDPEKRRQYQREWSRRHESKVKLERRERLKLMRPAPEKVQTWEECVERARGLIGDLRYNKVRIAGLAQAACVIEHGGNRRILLEDIPVFSLSNFARAVGINRFTLSDWVLVKRHVIDLLPPEIEEIEFTSAKLAYEYGRKHKVDPIPYYLKLVDKSSPEKGVLATMRYAKGIRWHLEKFGAAGLHDTHRVQLEELAALITKTIKEKK